MEISVRGTKTRLSGTQRKVGGEAPSARVYTLDGTQTVIGSEQINAQIIVVIPSLKTEVCSYGAKKFNEMLKSIDKLDAIAITTDDAEVVNDFVGKNCIESLKFYLDKDGMFGKTFGVAIEEGSLAGKLARAVFVIDREGNLTYSEIVSEITDEANYDTAVEAATEAAKKKKKGQHGHHHHGW